MEIKRYTEDAPGPEYYGLDECEDGEWVKYADHAAEVARLKAQLDASQRDCQEFAKLAGQNAARAQIAEAELKRRDAQEPVYQMRLLDGGENQEIWAEVTEEEYNTPTTNAFGVWERRKLYPEAPAVVLPPEIKNNSAALVLMRKLFNGGAVPSDLEIATRVWNECRKDAKALRCQPEKVVKLPELVGAWVACSERMPEIGRYLVKYNNPFGDEIVTAKYVEHDFCAGSGNIHRFWLDDRSRGMHPMKDVTHWMPLPTFDEAGVKWEDGSEQATNN